MIWVNGKQSSVIPVTDRGLQYGDGVWETMAIKAGKPQLLQPHLKRLQRGLKALNIQGLRLPALQSEIISLCENNKNIPKLILKIIITRGSGGRGYNPMGLYQPTRILSLHPYPKFPTSYRKEGITLFLCKTRLGHNPRLAGFKHLNRLEQVLARGEFDAPYQEGLVLDYQDNVIEGTMSNVFMIEDDEILTPNLEKCGIQGIQRSCIINCLNSNGYEVKIQPLSLNQIKNADAIFMTNSIINFWPVRQFAGKHYSLSKIPHEICF